MKFKLGSDPELMLTNDRGELKSAIPVFPGGKGTGETVAEGQGAVLHDNVLVEFNTQPAENEAAFIKTAAVVLADIARLAKEKQCELRIQASANFPDTELDHPEAHVFGCEPDFNAWQVMMNESPSGAGPFRSSGGHLHIGYGEDEHFRQLMNIFYGKIEMIRLLDIFCGIPSLFLDKDPTSPDRRKLYGKAGSHRIKDYGVEYRAMSAWWLASPQHTSLIYKLAAVAVETISKESIKSVEKTEGAGKHLTEIITKIGKVRKIKTGGFFEVQRIINEADIVAAREVYEKVIAPLLAEDVRELVIQLDQVKTTDLYAAWNIRR